MPQLSATFVPGGMDDYHMPELVAPTPQRVMAEVPQNMQEDLQRLELEVRSTERRRNLLPKYPLGDMDATVMNAPNFSPFPRPKGERLPLSFSEKEEIIFGARQSVLGSDNVVLQLSWARDVLQWVEIAADVAAKDWVREGKGRERPATPKFLRELKMDAINIVECLAEQSHPEATFIKGKWKELGKFGEREDRQEAYSFYKKAADLNYGRAEYRLAMLYENSNDMMKAIEHYRIGAEKLGDSAASYRLGMLYLWGQHGFPQDYMKGLQLINMAADGADEESPQGAYVFGMLVARELPDMEVPEGLLPYDVHVAKNYIERAACLGFSKAQLKMGQAYELSQLGCDFNPTYSLHYYGLAALQNQPEASLGVSRWFLFGSTDGSFDKNEGLAFKYAQDAADAGLATGQFAMGYYHEVGIHVQKDLREARRWYDVAAEHGNKDAVGRIEALKQSKLLTKQDHETTTLTRIKSQHGSQRGGRPERFARPNQVMNTVAEAASASASAPGYMRAAGPSSKLAVRSRSTAPYADEKPRGSTAPYPEDDTRGRRPSPSPHYNQGRPSNAFGIRAASPRPHLPAGYRQHSPGPSRQDLDYRGPQPLQQSPYRQPSPGQASMYRRPSPGRYGSLGPAGGTPVPDATRNRLQKSNPSPQGSLPYPSPPASGPPGREYRTPSDTYGYQGGSYPYGSSDNGPPPRVDSAQPGRQGYGGPKPRPGLLEGQGGRASAPPTQQQHYYNKPSPPMASPPPGSASTTNLGSTRPGAAGIAHPDGKTMGNGPATFEEMGIPQGKNDSDCVSYPVRLP